MQKITPFLWFDNQAEEAMEFYTSIFKASKVLNVNRNGKAGPGPEGSVMTASFEINGQEFIALNGGPSHKFTEAVSFVIGCDTQEEVDYFWEKLTENGGTPDDCGWVKDRFGLSWQVIPTILPQLMNDPDPEKANRVTQAMLQMDKINISELQKAYDQQ